MQLTLKDFLPSGSTVPARYLIWPSVRSVRKYPYALSALRVGAMATSGINRSNADIVSVLTVLSLEASAVTAPVYQ